MSAKALVNYTECTCPLITVFSMPPLNPYLGRERASLDFEWELQVTGLKFFLDSTKGEIKSEFTESPVFGEGRWRVLSRFS